jgi:tape measure domain-containing protein
MALMGGDNEVDILIKTTSDIQGVENAGKSLDRLGGITSKNAAIMGALAGVVSGITNRAIGELGNLVSDAVKRVDTLKNANRTFENMGFSASATKDMMGLLNKSILGLPTSLDSAVRNVELLASSTNDIGRSQKIFQALNDGIIGFGGTTDQVNTAVIQLSQAFAGGRIQAQDWNSMLNAGLGPALNAIAKQMGITTAQLKDGLSNGSISVQKFQDALIQLDQKGGGGMASLQKIAHDSTSGIGTGMENARTAVVRGIADIVNAIGASNISGAISSLGVLLEGLFKRFAAVISFIEQHHVVIAVTAGIIMAFLVPAFITWTVAAGAAAVATIAATWPVIAIGAAIGLLAYLVVTHWGTIRGAFEAGASFINSTWQFIVSVFNSAWGAIRNIVASSMDFIFQQWQRIMGIIMGPLVIITGAILSHLNIITSYFTSFWATVRNLFAAGLDFIRQHWQLIVGIILGPMVAVVGIVISHINQIVSFFSSMVGRIAGAISGITGVIVAPFQSAFNIIKGGLQGVLNDFNRVKHDITSAPGNITSGLKGLVGRIPGFAGGVQNFGGGLAVVGEQGPELVNLPRGSSVLSNRDSSKLANSTTTYNIQQVVLSTAESTREFFNIQDRNSVLVSKGLSAVRM